MKIQVSIPLVLVMAISVACSSSTPPPATTDAAPTGVARSYVRDPSFIEGACRVEPADGGADSRWVCPNNHECLILDAFGIRAENCVGAVCPVCVRSGRFSDYLSCPPGQSPISGFSYPPQVSCVDTPDGSGWAE